MALISVDENVQAYSSKWCKNGHVHTPHAWARKEGDGQLHPYYCPGTWEEIKEEDDGNQEV